MKYTYIYPLLLIVAISFGVLWTCLFPLRVDMHFGKFPFLCIPSSLFGLVAAATVSFYVLKVPVLKNVICYIGQFSIVYFAADASIGFWGFCCATKFGWVDIVAESIPEMTSVYILIIRLFTLTLFVPVVWLYLIN